jgi:hypothetical protein
MMDAAQMNAKTFIICPKTSKKNIAEIKTAGFGFFRKGDLGGKF